MTKKTAIIILCIVLWAGMCAPAFAWESTAPGQAEAASVTAPATAAAPSDVPDPSDVPAASDGPDSVDVPAASDVSDPSDVPVAESVKEYSQAMDAPDPEEVEGLEAFTYKRLMAFLPEGSLQDSLQDTFGATEAVYYEPLEGYVLQYESSEQCRNAYKRLVKIFGAESIIPSLPVQSEWEQEDSALTPAGSTSWGNDAMMLDALRDKANASGPSRKLIVATLDSGVRRTHNLLNGRISSASFAMKGYESTLGSYDYMDDNGHGTHVAGIIADGTSRQVEILAVKATNSQGRGDFSTMLIAMEEAASRGAKVINMSFGSDKYSYGGGLSQARFKKLVNVCEAKVEEICRKYDCMVVVASGNSGKDMQKIMAFPGGFPGVVTVGAVGAKNYKTAQYAPARFSNYGTTMDFGAPGVGVYSAANDADNLYRSGNGTSMAAPHVAAAAAMVRLYNPGMNRTETEDVLRSCAVDIAPNGVDKYTGCGMITFRSGTVPSVISLNGAETSAPAMSYTGKALCPAVSVRGRTYTRGKECTVTYANNVKIGYGSYTLKGRGRYSGTVSGRFLVVPRGTKLTKVKRSKKKLRLKWKKQKVQTSGYQLQISTGSGFGKDTRTILVKGSGKSKVTIRKLKSKTRYYVRIRTYKDVGKMRFFSYWSKVGTVKTK